MALGARVVETTPRASFKIMPSKERASKEVIEYPFQREKFYLSKRGFLVEKSKYRIDRPEELKGITYKGIRANKIGLGKKLFSSKKLSTRLKL